MYVVMIIYIWLLNEVCSKWKLVINIENLTDIPPHNKCEIESQKLNKVTCYQYLCNGCGKRERLATKKAIGKFNV